MTTAIGTRAEVRKRLTRTTPRSGALEGLRVLDAADLPRWKSALERGRESGFGCYFPYVLAHHRPGRTVLVGEDAGCLCVFIRRDRKRRSHLDLFLNPIPMDVGVARRCLDRANEFNGDRSARILRIDGDDAALAARVPGLSVRERQMQYLFAPQAFADLRGGKYRTLRTNVTRTRKLPDIEVLPWSARFAGACRELLRRWSERHRRISGTSGGAGTSELALALADQLPDPDLTGEVVLLDGRLVSYCLGGELRTGLGCFLDAKCDLDVPGLGYFQRWSFLTRLGVFERVNDGSDARSSGLRQMKNSLRPVAMYPEFRGSQVAP
jgi:hypothetical protein